MEGPQTLKNSVGRPECPTGREIKQTTSFKIFLINLSSDPDLTSYKSVSDALHVVLKYKESIVEKARN